MWAHKLPLIPAHNFMNILTQDLVRAVSLYCHETGIFIMIHYIILSQVTLCYCQDYYPVVLLPGECHCGISAQLWKSFTDAIVFR